MQLEDVQSAFAGMMTKIVAEFSDPIQVSALMNKNIKVGDRLASELNVDYKKALYQRMLADTDALTEKVDWLQ